MTGIDVMGLDKVASIADASEILIASLNRYTADRELVRVSGGYAGAYDERDTNVVRLSGGYAGASCLMRHSAASCPISHTEPQTSPAPPLSQQLQMVSLKPRPYTQNYKP